MEASLPVCEIVASFPGEPTNGFVDGIESSAWVARSESLRVEGVEQSICGPSSSRASGVMYQSVAPCVDEHQTGQHDGGVIAVRVIRSRQIATCPPNGAVFPGA
ncbi:hypothetical protein BJF85_20615 [Saccharomonospora sp. CUA-673]|nr:hypothetical protein BJF85_20615 [Saccharomonospora sp. CUA-673]